MIGSIEVVDPAATAPAAGPPKGDRWLQDEWRIGSITADLGSLLEVGRQIPVTWFECPRRGTFLADPFPVGDDAILCEEYRYLRARGQLVRFRAAAGQLVERVELSDPTVHHSYPSVVHVDGDDLVVPEHSGRPGVFLHTAQGDTLVDPRCLIPDVHALDPTIVAFGGLWWAFFSERSGTPMGRRLDLWFSETLRSGWRRHPASPLLHATPTKRPAGTPFEIDGTLYRPSQDCTHTYGGRILLNRVDVLTPTEFHEHPVAAIQLTGGATTDGIHTLGIAGNRLLLDGKRRRLRADALAGRALRRLRPQGCVHGGRG